MTGSSQPTAGTGTGPDANAIYSLGSSEGETARLQRQADELAPDSHALLGRTGLRPGQSAIDLGCGPRGILDLLARRVSPGGTIVGLDADPAHAAMAARLATERGLDGVQILTADALWGSKTGHRLLTCGFAGGEGRGGGRIAGP
jgi:SAM-dependent methyltransferase